MLPPEHQRAQNEEVEGALEQGDAIGFVLGRHST
jgi:hypothetical protein